MPFWRPMIRAFNGPMNIPKRRPSWPPGICSVSGVEARDDLEVMFKKFMKLNPKSIGGKLPDAGLYQ